MLLEQQRTLVLSDRSKPSVTSSTLCSSTSFSKKHQEEIDQLLRQTHLAMRKMVQSEGCSPRCRTSGQQIKSASDSIGSSSNSIPSHGKAKKRNKAEQLDIVKRAHGPKACDGHPDGSQNVSTMRCQIAKITDKGGLFNFDGVEILLNLMQHDGSEKKLELAGRILLADVIAATDKLDCLFRFMQLKGLLVLSDWLQEAHKTKAGDVALKENDKSVEELLLALLRALDKLPVDLHALQTSNIGKSVNNLRTHKNVEVQKKARSLVDTWKKRVDKEMTKINDVKPVSGQSGSPSSKANFTEGSHETGTCRTSSVKSTHGEPSLKSSTSPLGNKKSSNVPFSAASHTRDLQCKSEGTSRTSEMHFTMLKEEKSSGSSQSLGNRQSSSSDHTKTMGTSCKDDAQISIIASTTKSSGGVSKHQKSTIDVLEVDVPETRKESNSGKSHTTDQNKTADRLSQHGVTWEGKSDFPVADGNGKRLIIKFQRNSSQSDNGDASEENSVAGSRASSPGSPWKHDRNDPKRKMKEDVCQTSIVTDINVETRKSDTKKTVTSKKDDKTPIAHCESHRSTDENGIVDHMPKSSFSSSRKEKAPVLIESKSGKSSIHSIDSMIALVESCVKQSEPSASTGTLSVGDDIGIELLASVATGELSKCDHDPSLASPARKILASDILSTADEEKSRFQNILHQGPRKYAENIDFGSNENTSNASTSAERGKQLPCIMTVPHERVPLGQHAHSSANPKNEINEQSIRGESAPNRSSNNNGKVQENNRLNAASQNQEKLNSEEQSNDCLPSQKNSKCTHPDKDMVLVQEKTTALHELKTKETVGKSQSSHMIVDTQDTSIEGLDALALTKPDLPLDGVALVAEARDNILKYEKSDGDTLGCLGPDTAKSVPISGSKIENSNNLNMMSYSETYGGIKKKQTSPSSPVLENNIQSKKVTHGTGDDGSDSQGNKIEEHHPDSQGNKIQEHHLTALATQEKAHVTSNHEVECVKPMDSNLARCGSGELAFDKGAKCDFDLNEQIMSDEGSQGESACSQSLMCSSTATLPNLAPFTVSLVSSTSTAPITVASPAKGPFFPPENPLKKQAALGWKGSAATSAFRPTEPRKVLEMSLSASEVLVGGAVVKENHQPLEIDLNVPDERIAEEMVSYGSLPERCSISGADSAKEQTLDLDLNKTDEVADNGQFLLSTSRKLETTQATLSNSRMGGLRQLDLNDGPDLEEIHADSISRNQQTMNSVVPLIPPIGDLKMNSTELGSLTSWPPQGNSYPPVAIAPLLTEIGDQTYPIAGPAGARRFLGSAVGGVSFGGDIYRGTMLSSPAMASSSAGTFPYNGFTFNSSYPLAPASFSGGTITHLNSSSGGGVPCFPVVSSQIMGPANATSSAYVRPYLVNVPDGNRSGNGSDNGRKWGKQSLDLNAGPGIADIEGREEKLLPTLRQPSITIPQAFAEEHGRIYHVPGSGVKRKEPESGWGTERFPYKQLSWQ